MWLGIDLRTYAKKLMCCSPWIPIHWQPQNNLGKSLCEYHNFDNCCVTYEKCILDQLYKYLEHVPITKRLPSSEKHNQANSSNHHHTRRCQIQTKKHIYLTYIDFKNAFSSIDHLWLLAIMEDLGYPPYAIALVGNIYAESPTSFKGTHFATTCPIIISWGPI